MRTSYISSLGMLYCPRCNNTHWTLAPPESQTRLARLTLKRSYRCNKCGKIKQASVFLDHDSDEAPPIVVCPLCEAPARRSRRKGLERLLFFFRAFRCTGCRHRFRKVQVRHS